MNQHHLILKALQSELWAITPEGLSQIIAIAKGMGDPEALMAKVGKPLSNTQEIVVRDSVAIMPVIGPIFRYANLFTQISGATSIQTLATDFQTALDDPAIEAIILDINSPGGQIAGISEFSAQVNAARKPVYTYVSDLAASAGYWIASAAREIIAADTSRLGSIGVVMQASIGEDNETIEFISSQSPFKRVDPQSDHGKIQNQKTVDALAEVFISAVASYRDTTREAVIANFGQGGMHIAADAIGAGMADRLGSLESLISQLSSGTPFSTPFRQGNFAMNPNQLLTKEKLAADQPDLVKAITDEGYAAGLQTGISQGAESERKRIQGIDDLDALGHDDLIKTFKFDGQTTAAEVALKILGAEKQTRLELKEKISQETPRPVHLAPAAFNEDQQDESSKLSGEEKWKHDWQHSADLQAEFKEIGAYIAYQKANEKGLVKRLGAKA